MGLPFLKMSKVGIDIILNLAANSWDSSTLTFATLSLPFKSFAISSTIGLIIRHGPHHSAQKSTKTGKLDLSTSASKFLSVTCATRSEEHTSELQSQSNLVCP